MGPLVTAPKPTHKTHAELTIGNISDTITAVIPIILLTGTALALLGSLQSISTFLAPIIFQPLYSATVVRGFPGVVFFAAGGICLLAFTLFVYVVFYFCNLFMLFLYLYCFFFKTRDTQESAVNKCNDTCYSPQSGIFHCFLL